MFNYLLKNRYFILLAVISLVAFAIIFLVSLSNSQPLSKQAHISKIVVDKSLHRMMLMDGEHILNAYQVALGRGGTGPKLRMGDNKVPEGKYFISEHNYHSRFHIALRISYPNAYDLDRPAEMVSLLVEIS